MVCFSMKKELILLIFKNLLCSTMTSVLISASSNLFVGEEKNETNEVPVDEISNIIKNIEVEDSQIKIYIIILYK